MIVHHFTTPITTPFARKSTQIYGDLRRLWEKAKIKESAKKPEITGLCRLIKGYKIMIKVLFVCHGNICRSPISEYVLKDMVEKRGLTDAFEIASAATSTEEIWNGKGNPIYPPAQAELRRHGIGETAYTNFSGKRARQVTKQDYQYYDYLLCADSNNIRNTLRITGPDKEGKVKLLLDFTDRPGRSIADPWYTGNFKETYRDVYEGCTALLEKLGF